MSFKIYTKTGDMGTTSLIGGKKVSKNDLRIESYGTVDELNSYIGLVSDCINDTDSKIILNNIQDRLFTIGSSLACDSEKDLKIKIPDLHETDIVFLENEIDKMNEHLPIMKSFILPVGHTAVSTTHVARCICRRAERICVNLQMQQLFIEPLIIKYLNRLSDFLFVLARYIAHLLNVTEIPWVARV